MFTSSACVAQKDVQPEEKQIKAAVSAIPEGMREGAGVLGYNQESELVTLRERTNELICLADDPADDRFHVACYHYELEPFMERGRELRAEGKSSDEVTTIRRQEIEAGKIPMPDKPMALYSLTASEEGYDYSSGTVLQARPLYVIYVPFATEKSTGIASRPISEGAPWLMNPGDPWAHIMVSTGTEVGTKTKAENE
ncbi:hypothetical protein G3570_12740 [Balneolaceae bacterium YR4-1]|uniref:Uncharacterized protein n=1 Tax=Halalkalibaculum roseum TaxID=2709311 RepID=A0A6M1T433_9BACT|nr:hypothetical protein [Halalkalibaculum roseum]